MKGTQCKLFEGDAALFFCRKFFAADAHDGACKLCALFIALQRKRNAGRIAVRDAPFLQTVYFDLIDLQHRLSLHLPDFPLCDAAFVEGIDGVKILRARIEEGRRVLVLIV